MSSEAGSAELFPKLLCSCWLCVPLGLLARHKCHVPACKDELGMASISFP